MLLEEVRDATTWLTLDRPDRLNAFTGGDYNDLRVAIERATAELSAQ